MQAETSLQNISIKDISQTDTSGDVFYVTYSKWKVWIYTCLHWLLAGIVFVILFKLIEQGLERGTLLDIRLSAFLFITWMPIGLFWALKPFIYIKWLNRPFAMIRPEGVLGRRFFRDHLCLWTPETVMYYWILGSLMLTSPDAENDAPLGFFQSPKTAAMIHNGLAKQKRDEVIDAIDRIAPYRVRTKTLWDIKYP